MNALSKTDRQLAAFRDRRDELRRSYEGCSCHRRWTRVDMPLDFDRAVALLGSWVPRSQVDAFAKIFGVCPDELEKAVRTK